jgi:NADPH:quinone reductase-like Zn-dependent oxidoreductase
MKAIVWTRFGPPEVLQLQEVAKPTPKDKEVLIHIHATTVTAGECQLRGLNIPLVYRLPLRIVVALVKRRRARPIILGQELAGEIEAVGAAVTRFQPGDQVFAWTSLSMGGYAEYACLSENGVLAIKPSTMTYEEAATLPIGGLDALYFMRKARIQHGEKMLINGAGGSIGTYAVQLAKYFGAEVTAVDSGGKLDMLRSIGADQVVDYTKEDFTKRGETYHVIFDVIGKSSFSRSLRALRPHGRYLLGTAGLSQQVRGQGRLRSGGKQVILWASRTASQYAEDCAFLTTLIEAGKLTAVVDGSYPLEQTAEAHRYVETGQKKGHVVITVAQPSAPSQSDNGA